MNGLLNIQNVGNVNARSSFVKFYLSEDDVYDEGADIFLKQVAIGVIRTGTSKVMRLSYSLPLGETAAGRYVIAVIDANNAVQELDKGNNLVVFGPIQ